MKQQTPLKEPLGTDELVGCGRSDADAVGEVEPLLIKGVAPTDAVAGTVDQAQGLYMRDDLDADRQSRPEPLRQ